MELNPLHFTDKNNKPLVLGDMVNVTKGKKKGNVEWVLVFCIPQHRFGFILKRFYDDMVSNNNKNLYGTLNKVPEPFVIDHPNLDFYWTPKSKTEIIKIY